MRSAGLEAEEETVQISVGFSFFKLVFVGAAQLFILVLKIEM